MDGVSNFAVPTIDEVLLGEYAVYGNYGLPNEFLLGFVNEGFKLSITRETHLIKVNGAYCNNLDSNGVPLIRIDRMVPVLTIPTLTLRYQNNDILSGGETGDNWESNDWAATGGTYEAETTIAQTGYKSAKMTADTNQYGIHEVFSSAKDLTVFENGETATTSDYICFSLYITTQDLTDLGTSDLRFAFHMDAEGTETNYYYYDVAAGDLTADVWNNFKVLKSAFTEQGSGDWSAVTGVSLKLEGAPSAEVICYIDSINHLKATVESSPVSAGQGGKYSHTDEGDYKRFVPYLPIPDNKYLDNVGITGQQHSGKAVDIILENCYDDGSVNLAIQEKLEVVSNCQFTGHYRRETPTICPVEFRHYKAIS